MKIQKELTRAQLRSRLISAALYVPVIILMIITGFRGQHHKSGWLAVSYLVLLLAWCVYSIWTYRRHPLNDPATDQAVLESLRKRSLGLAILGGGILLFLLFLG